MATIDQLAPTPRPMLTDLAVALAAKIQADDPDWQYFAAPLPRVGYSTIVVMDGDDFLGFL